VSRQTKPTNFEKQENSSSSKKGSGDVRISAPPGGTNFQLQESSPAPYKEESCNSFGVIFLVSGILKTFQGVVEQTFWKSITMQKKCDSIQLKKSGLSTCQMQTPGYGKRE
jgi:hypothetical protein